MSRIETIGNATLSIKAGRKRALRMYPDIGPCTECGASKAERHHRDENTANNTPENIAFLCRRCHMESDGRLVALAALASTRSPELIAAAAAEKNSRTHCKRGHRSMAKTCLSHRKGLAAVRSAESSTRLLIWSVKHETP